VASAPKERPSDLNGSQSEIEERAREFESKNQFSSRGRDKIASNRNIPQRFRSSIAILPDISLTGNSRNNMVGVNQVQYVRSSERYPTASDTCVESTSFVPSRSAIVLLTFKIRS